MKHELTLPNAKVFVRDSDELATWFSNRKDCKRFADEETFLKFVASQCQNGSYQVNNLQKVKREEDIRERLIRLFWLRSRNNSLQQRQIDDPMSSGCSAEKLFAPLFKECVGFPSDSSW